MTILAEEIKSEQGKTFVVNGRVLVQLRSFDWQYGDQVRLYGKLELPPEDEAFSYRDYLARNKVYSLMAFPRITLIQHDQGNLFMAWLYKLRQHLDLSIQTFIPQPEAALLSGILLGIETDIPPQLEDAFQKTGTAHIIAISGFNMTLLAGLFLRGFKRWLPIWWAGVTAVCVISIYTLFVGAAPAVQRAAIMSALSMTGALIGRKQAGPFTLLLTSAVMISVNPLLLWDAGFQLSVMATLGLILYADKILTWFETFISHWVKEEKIKKISGPVGEYFLFTLAAQFTIFPVLLFHFESFSLSSFLANPLILPPQPLIMIFGGGIVILGAIFPFLGKPLGMIVWLPLAYTNHMVQWLAEIPFGVIRVGQVSWSVVVLIYGVMFVLTIKNKLRDWLFVVWKPVFGAGLSVCAALLIWNYALHLPDQQLTIHVFGNPYQEGIYLITPAGNEILINPGEHGNTISAQINREKSVFDRNLDMILISDARQQAYAALPMLVDRYQIGQVLWFTDPPHTSLTRQLDVQLQDRRISSFVMEEGGIIDCGDGVFVEEVFSTDDTSLLRIRYENFSFLILYGDESYRGVDALDPAVVVFLEDEEKFSDWTEFETSLIILREQTIDQSGSVLALNRVNGVEIKTDGEKMFLFKY